MKNTEWLTKRPTAHRGLHNNKDAPENSMLAFKRAVDNGYNIEFDVWLTKDNHLIIHHDNTLKRTCGIDMHPVDIDCSHIENYKIMGTDQHIPFLKDFLELVDGKVNLICEIKPTNNIKNTCEAIYEMFKDYKGLFCIESFDIRIVNWWYKHHPEIILGQLFDPNILHRWAALAFNHTDKVDFLAICVKNVLYKPFKTIKKKHPEKLIIVWTVRTKEQLDLVLKNADNYIFECNEKNPEYIEKPSIT